MRQKLPHLIIITALTAIAHQSLLIAEWARALAPTTDSSFVTDLCREGYRFAFDLTTGVFVWQSTPPLARLIIAIMQGVLRTHTYAGYAVDVGCTWASRRTEQFLRWLLTKVSDDKE